MVSFPLGIRGSPSNHVAAPGKTTSFSGNWPGIVERAGKAPDAYSVNHKANPANHERYSLAELTMPRTVMEMFLFDGSNTLPVKLMALIMSHRVLPSGFPIVSGVLPVM